MHYSEEKKWKYLEMSEIFLIFVSRSVNKHTEKENGYESTMDSIIG